MGIFYFYFYVLLLKNERSVVQCHVLSRSCSLCFLALAFSFESMELFFYSDCSGGKYLEIWVEDNLEMVRVYK